MFSKLRVQSISWSQPISTFSISVKKWWVTFRSSFSYNIYILSYPHSFDFSVCSIDQWTICFESTNHSLLFNCVFDSSWFCEPTSPALTLLGHIKLTVVWPWSWPAHQSDSYFEMDCISIIICTQWQSFINRSVVYLKYFVNPIECYLDMFIVGDLYTIH